MNWRRVGEVRQAEAAKHPIEYAVPSAVDLCNATAGLQTGRTIGDVEVDLVSACLISVDGERMPAERDKRREQLLGCPEPEFIHEAFNVIFEAGGGPLKNS